jgi:O-antigen ligase
MLECRTVASIVSRAPLIAATPIGASEPSLATPQAFKLFLVLNGIMFLRPGELIPRLAPIPFYELVILACLVMAAPAILPLLTSASLARNPLTLCVFGMLPAIVMSLFAQGDLPYAQERGIEFVKVILYYLLLVSLVDSTRRLRTFLIAVAMYTLVLNVIALLSYHDIVNLSTVSPYAEGQFQADPSAGERQIVVRLQAMGVYGNPNGLARIIAVGILISLFEIARRRQLLARAWWVGVAVVLGHALQLTYSRGGLLGLMASIVVLFHARFGMKKGGAAILVLLPMLVLFSGRQTDIDTSSGTGQLRIQLWSNGLVALRSSPVFGIGAGYYFRTAGNDAHNSFVEAYVENGLIGGTIFTSAFVLAIVGLYRCKSDVTKAVDPELWQLRPFILAIVVGTVVGQFSSSRVYFPPTYMIVGLATIYLTLVGRHVRVGIMRVTPGLVVRMSVVGVVTLVFLHLYTKLNARF